MKYADGSLACIQYVVTGSASLGKEYIESHWDGKSAVLADFKSYVEHGRSRQDVRAEQIDKGQLQLLAEFLRRIRASESSPIAIAEILQTSRVTINLAQAVVAEV